MKHRKLIDEAIKHIEIAWNCLGTEIPPSEIISWPPYYFCLPYKLNEYPTKHQFYQEVHAALWRDTANVWECGRKKCETRNSSLEEGGCRSTTNSHLHPHAENIIRNRPIFALFHSSDRKGVNSFVPFCTRLIRREQGEREGEREQVHKLIIRGTPHHPPNTVTEVQWQR